MGLAVTKGRARAAGIFVILLTFGLAAAALVELHLESRDAVRLTSGETFVQLGSARVRYRLAGTDRKGAPVVLLTGAIASIEQWALVAPEIARTHPVLAYDRGGLGFSAGSHAHSAGAQAEELAQLLEALHLHQPVVLLGFSSSSLVARLFAERHPDRLAGLVLLDPDFPEYELELRGSGHGVLRAHLRSTSTATLMALLGISRLRASLSGWKPASLDDERTGTALTSFHFWWAESRMLWAAPASQREVVAAQGPLPPLILIAKALPPANPRQVIMDRLLARSVHGELWALPADAHHQQLLDDPALRGSLVTAANLLASLR